MAKRRDKRPVDSPQAIKAIVSKLEKIEASGNASYHIFQDFLDLVEAALDMLPYHLTEAAKSGQMAEDSPEAKATWERVKRRYPKGRETYYFNLFADAFDLLLTSAQPLPVWRVIEGGVAGPDIIGAVYEEYGYPKHGHGQFFTPWNVCLAMAMLTIMDGEREVRQNLSEAARKNPAGIAMALASTTIQDPAVAERFFFEKVLPVIGPETKPITIMEPCVGSGRMLLAIAIQYPEWVICSGLVQFYGLDIDPQCVQMCRINLKLYGIDIRYLKALAELTPEIIKRVLPEGWKEVYIEAKEMEVNGDKAGLEQLRKAIAQDQVAQLSLEF